MKKKCLVVVLVVICLFMVACKNKEEKSNDWVLSVASENDFIDEDVKEAIKDYNKELKPLVLLGEQVVAGTNYMYLCNDSNSFKVAVVYKDLEGKTQVTKVTDFDVTKYANENISMNAETLAGGWTTNMPGKPMTIDETVQEAFDEAKAKVIGVTYYPAKILATREKDGTSYAILCYGVMSDANSTTGVYVLTLYVTGNTKEIVSIANIDLKDYNK